MRMRSNQILYLLLHFFLCNYGILISYELIFRRNVGLPYPVGRDYFELIQNTQTMMENEHMDPYVAILAKDPAMAKLKKNINPRSIAISLTFMVKYFNYQHYK